MKKTLKDEIFYLIKSLDLNPEIRSIFEVMEKDDINYSKADAIYLFAQTKDNEKSVFFSAMKAVNKGLTNEILICGGKGFCGYPGYKNWLTSLQNFKINAKKVPLNNSGINTLVESNSLLEYINKKGLNSVFVTAAPFHSLRAFMTACSVAIRKNSNVQIRSLFGGQLPWNYESYHSQGVLRATRFGLIKYEMERIKKYTKKGDILPAREILDYLKKRQLK